MITIPQVYLKKERGEKIVMLTAYDYPLARLVAAAGVDMILIGDSGGMVKLGYSSTIPVTMDEMLMMVSAVRRGAPDTFLIADMPFMSYQVSHAQAIENAGRLIKEGGADAVKLEGGVRMADTVKAVTAAGIAVQGHIGLTPQNVTQLGGYRMQGKTAAAAKALIQDALALENAGIFSLILEAVPVRLANYLTRQLAAPTIGTGSGAGCDGQNLITPDLLGYYDGISPRYVKRYADISSAIGTALAAYKAEVIAGSFPAAEHTYPLKDDTFLDELFTQFDEGASL
jgi:3-methyl-2-oxobutanoate hydroxymethyltransferase